MENFGKLDVVRNYYGFVVHANLTGELQKQKSYGEELIQLTDATLRKWANDVPENVTKTEGMQHRAWIVYVLFCAMRYINDIRYLPGETTLKF